MKSKVTRPLYIIRDLCRSWQQGLCNLLLLVVGFVWKKGRTDAEKLREATGCQLVMMVQGVGWWVLECKVDPVLVWHGGERKLGW